MMEIRIRQAQIADVDQVVDMDSRVWQSYPTTHECIISRITVFPEGNLVSIINGKVVGYACCMFFTKTDKLLSWDQLTENGTIKNHDPNGKDFFGVALTIDPDFQQKGIGMRLMVGLGAILVRHGIEFAYLGSRIPHYHLHSTKYPDPKEYVEALDKRKRLLDPELDFYSKAGFTVVSVVPNYIDDPESLDYGVIIETKNPFFLLKLPRIKFLYSFYERIWNWLGLRMY